MGELPSLKARQLLKALLKAGYTVARSRGSHRFLRHRTGRSMVFAFHDGETIGGRMLSRVLKDAGLTFEEFKEYL